MFICYIFNLFIFKIFPKYIEIYLENLVLIVDNFNETLFLFFPLDYIQNILNLALKLLKKFHEENFFYTKTLQEDALLTKSVLIIHNICSFCFEELSLTYQNELRENINIFLSNTSKVSSFIKFYNRNF